MQGLERQPSPSPVPLHSVYQRKAALDRAGLGVASSSSSPLQGSSSSPHLTQMEIDEEVRARDPSCNTTISSEDEDESISGSAPSNIGKKLTTVKNAAIILSEGDESAKSDKEDNDDEEEEDDAAFLKRFREARAAKTAIPEQPLSSNPGAASSSSLSDPPTLSCPSQRMQLDSSHASRQHRNELSAIAKESMERRSQSISPAPSEPESTLHSKESPASSPYITEAQKQQDADKRREAREAKVRELALRRAKASEGRESVQQSPVADVDDDEEVSSASDVEGESLPSAIKAARLASDKRRRDDDRTKAKEAAFRKAQGVKGGVLEMRVDEESDSDLEIEANIPVKDKSKKLKPLNRKEEEELHRMQAKIERESKVRHAKQLRKIGNEARPTFGLRDLLSNIDKHEKAYGHGKESRIQDYDGNISDPIQSSSDGEVDTPGLNDRLLKATTSRANRFTPVIKPSSPSPPHDTKGSEDETEDLPDVIDMQKKLIEDRIKKSRYEAFKEKKMQALLKTVAQQKRPSDNHDADVEDDDFLIEDTRMTRKQEKKRETNSIGSPNAMSALSEEEMEGTVTDTQLRREGKSMNLLMKRSPSPKASRRKESKKNDKKRGVTAEELNESIKRKVHLQNIESRRKKEAAFSRRKVAAQKVDVPVESKDNVAEMLQKLREAHEKQGDKVSPDRDSEGEDSEFQPDAEVDDQEEEIDLGSAEEEDGEVSDDQEDAESESSDAESNDSEKENSMPPSQEIVQQPRIARRSRVLLDEDEEGEIQVSASIHRSPLQPIVIVHEDVEEERASAKEGPILAPSHGFSEFFQDSQAPAPKLAANDRSSSPSAPPARKTSSTLGKFFEDTQPNALLRGESFHVLPTEDEEGHSLPGFSQFFNEDTQQESEHIPTSHLMLPPNTSAKGLALLGGTDQDGFAALRKAQAMEAKVIESDTKQLPSLDVAAGLDEEAIHALEMEAMEAEAAERRKQERQNPQEEEVTYINRDGFFTQTKPDYDRYSMSESQSQDRPQASSKWGESLMQGSSLDDHLEIEGGKKKKRFRRAISIEGEIEDVNLQDASSLDVAAMNKDSIAEEVKVPLTSIDYGSRNAFDVMKDAAAENSTSPPRQERRNLFIQGEAEESEEEEEGPAGKKQKAGRGGLGGIFSDDDTDNGDEEEDDSEEDGRDLEELINEEKDEAEAEKDILARERYLKDVEADDQAALALHEKAARGGLRSKRRAVNLDGTLEGFLDDDYEDEWLEKKVKNPYKFVPKKRKLQGLDGLDLLEANEESQAFVKTYRESHEKETNLDKYSFLLPEEDEEEEAADRNRHGQGDLESDKSENEDEDEPKETISHQQLRRELEERRRKRKRQAIGLSDDEEERAEREAEEEEAQKEKKRAEEEEQMMKRIQREIYAHSSDEDDVEDDSLIHHIVRDRIKGDKSFEDIEMVPQEEDGDGEEENEHAFSALNRISNARTLSEAERQRLVQLQNEYANEPEWGHHDGKTHIARNSSGKGGSITSFKSSKVASSNSTKGSVSSNSNGKGKGIPRVRSRLSDVMSRRGQFSEVNDN